MAITRRDGFYYGESHDDLRTEILRYSRSVGYDAQHYRDAVCTCGHDTFTLLLNDDEGVAARTCTACETLHAIGDSDAYIDDVESVWQPECVCGCTTFRISAAVSLYADSEDVRWFYLGLFCTDCKLIGCYGDWKNEYIGYQGLLDKV